MDKEQAIEAMKQGKKLTHNYFSNDEWITIENNIIISEDGVKHHNFWGIRNSESWKTGWSIFQ